MNDIGITCLLFNDGSMTIKPMGKVRVKTTLIKEKSSYYIRIIRSDH